MAMVLQKVVSKPFSASRENANPVQLSGSVRLRQADRLHGSDDFSNFWRMHQIFYPSLFAR
jgi:hypothetical protein